MNGLECLRNMTQYICQTGEHVLYLIYTSTVKPYWFQCFAILLLIINLPLSLFYYEKICILVGSMPYTSVDYRVWFSTSNAAYIVYCLFYLLFGKYVHGVPFNHVYFCLKCLSSWTSLLYILYFMSRSPTGGLTLLEDRYLTACVFVAFNVPIKVIECFVPAFARANLCMYKPVLL